MNIWVKTLFVFLFFSLIFLPKNIEARSGCCSHHSGVCGCRCCDGSSLSATCAPYYPSCGGTTTTVKTIQPTKIPTKIYTPTTIYFQPTIAIPTNSNKSSSSDGSLGGLIVLGGLGFGGYKLVKKFKKKE